MKKSSYIYLATFLVATFLISSCNPLKKMNEKAKTITYTVTPNPLEMHKDTVVVTISGKVPVKYFKKKVITEVTPVLKYAGGESPLKTTKLQGEKIKENNTVINYTNGGSFSYSDKIAYKDAMRMTDLEIRIKGIVKKKELAFDPYKIGDGVIATPWLLQIDPKVIATTDKFVRITSESQSTEILYLINEANLRPTELKKEDVKKLFAYIKSLEGNIKKELKAISLQSYASPDGPLDLNTGLSGKRGNTSQAYLIDEIKKNSKDRIKEANKEKDKVVKKDKLDKINQDEAKLIAIVKSATTPADWEGFQLLVKSSDIPDKDLILRVLSMYSDNDVRNKELKNMSKVFRALADNILPKLRRSNINVNVDNVGYSDEELVAKASTMPDSLKVEELFRGAILTKGLENQVTVYNSFCNKFPTDWRGFNNLGYTYFNLKKYDEAKKAFEKAKELDASNTMVLNNIGACTLIEKDFIKAEEILVSANGAGSEVNYNLGICAIKKADYFGAAKYFGSDCSFNAALAMLLSADFDGANRTIDCSSNKDEAMMFYLKAVVGARQANADLVFNSLRAAVSKDASLIERAKTDMEFRKYFADDTFKTIVK